LDLAPGPIQFNIRQLEALQSTGVHVCLGLPAYARVGGPSRLSEYQADEEEQISEHRDSQELLLLGVGGLA
jgi:hypothetical protein